MEKLYKLIHVGEPIHDSNIGAYRIACYFQPWLISSNTPASEEIIRFAINSTFAGKLICGTIWSKNKQLDKVDCNLPADYQTITIEPGMIHAYRLKDLFNPNNLSPAKFWSSHENTWVIQSKYNNKIIILTYFELLRVCLYATSRRITDFLFSQNSINSLCIPLEFPNISNLSTARYCIATERFTASEARLIGSLLFDPKLLYAFNLSQAYWRNIISKNHTGIRDKTSSIIIGDFSNFSFNAKGQVFLYNNTEYFWVNNLEITDYKHVFNTLLLYPIHTDLARGIAHDSKKSIVKDTNQPKCTDILQLTYQQASQPEMQRVSEAMRQPDSNIISHLSTHRQWLYAINKAGSLPLVVRRLPWAVSLPYPSDFYESERLLKESAQYMSLPFKAKAIHTLRFRKLINTFKSRGFTTKTLLLNNPSKSFGRNISVLPINKFPPLPLSLYENHINYFSCVEIYSNNTPFYLAQPFPESNPELVILFIKQNLVQPELSEWNELLSNITPVYGRYDLKSFYKKINHTKFKQASYNIAFLAIPVPCTTVTVSFCIDLVAHIAERFRKRLQFVLATSLRYPAGVTVQQQKKIIVLSRNMCTAPDASWLVRIFFLWN